MFCGTVSERLLARIQMYPLSSLDMNAFLFARPFVETSRVESLPAQEMDWVLGVTVPFWMYTLWNAFERSPTA